MQTITRLLLIPLLLAPLAGCDPVTAFGGAVVGTAAVVTDRRTTGALLDDQNIELKTMAIVAEREDLAKQVQLAVTAFNGIVLLTGEAITPAARDEVSEIARRVENVRQVHNEMDVGELSGAGQQANDGWITAKVKSNLLASADAEGLHVKVVTENAVVYLMGLVSRDQGRLAAEIARDIHGVTRVVKIFEYTD